MKLRFTVNFGEIEVEDFSKPLVLVVNDKEFNKIMKHIDAEKMIWSSEVLVYNPDKFDLYNYPNLDEEDNCYRLYFKIAEVEAGNYSQTPDMIPNFFNKLWDKISKAWEKYAKCLEKKGESECEEPLTRKYYRIIFIFDPDFGSIKKMFLERILASSNSIVTQRFTVGNPETIITRVEHA